MVDVMTHRQRMLAAIRGEPCDRIPWAPRLDLWYRANKLAGTLPEKYRDATLRDMTDDLGWGYHAIVPDFTDMAGGGDDSDRALGIYNLSCMPYRTVLENVEKTVSVDGDRTLVEYRTPKGAIRTVTVYDQTMREAGISISHIAEHAFRSEADYQALGFIFENARVEPNYEGYEQYREFVGERGLAAAFVSLAASPMHLVQRELMLFETFIFEMNDRPAELERLAESIEIYWQKITAATAAAPAELVFMGANYDAMITYPPFFAEHILPTLKAYAGKLHAKDKYLLTHTDGENAGLLEHYIDAGFDVADSICPAPMTSLSFKQHRDAFGGGLTIMGGIPSVALLEASMNDDEFSAYLGAFFEAIGRGDHLILGISDTTPPGAKFERLVEIARRAEAFGPVGTGAGGRS
jgi:uroporphyrinogen-III decarboxylase